MSQELLYTSAPRGLRPGSGGFCTVCHTQGLPPNVAERLEALSAYRHVYAPHDPNAGSNPVVYSHLLLAIGGRVQHVLSRIAAAGVDHTQRANKLAHHLVLGPAELQPAGPAWLLGATGLMQTSWDGEVKIRPAGRRILPGDAPAAVCHAWQRLTGDAGWGGVLAETAAGGSKGSVTLIFPPGMDMLPLLGESLALLPPEQRWNVTFSTYFTTLPAGVDCKWRCVLQGSPEAVGRAPGPVIDLSAPLPRAAGGPLVEAARTGVVHRVSRAPLPVASVPAAHADAEIGFAEEDGLPTPSAPPILTPSVDADPYRLEPPALPAGAVEQRLRRAPKSKPKGPSSWILVVGVLGVGVVLFVGVLTFWLSTRGGERTKEVAAGGAEMPRAEEQPKGTGTLVKKDNEIASAAGTPPTRNATGEGDEGESEKASAEDAAASVASGSGTSPAGDRTVTQSAMDPEPAIPAPTEVPKEAPVEAGPNPASKEPFRELAKAVDIGIYRDSKESTGKTPLGKVNGLKPAEYEFQLLGVEQAFGPHYRADVKFEPGDEMSGHWKVVVVSLIPNVPEETIAAIDEHNGELTFSWVVNSLTPSASLLCNCLLQVNQVNQKDASTTTAIKLRTVGETKLAALGFPDVTDLPAGTKTRVPPRATFEVRALPKEFDLSLDVVPGIKAIRKQVADAEWTLEIGRDIPLQFRVRVGRAEGGRPDFVIDVANLGPKLNKDEWRSARAPHADQPEKITLEDVKSHLVRIGAELDKVGKQLKQKNMSEEDIAKVNEKIAGIRKYEGKVIDLQSSMHGLPHAKIEYRVYTKVAGHEVDLALSEGYVPSGK